MTEHILKCEQLIGSVKRTVTEVTYSTDRSEVRVTYRGEGPDGPMYAVLREPFVLDAATGKWVHEPCPSARTAEFIAATRYSFDRACELAEAASADLRER